MLAVSRMHRTVVVADSLGAVPWQYRVGTRIVRTPLDMIQALESSAIRRVILVGAFASDRSFAAFVRETYPDVMLTVVAERHELPIALEHAFAS
jgi:hypothetical protein